MNKGFDFRNLTPEQLAVRNIKAAEARRKLNPPAPRKKKDLTGERLKLIEETTDRIREIISREGLNYKELAVRLDMTPGHVSHLMSGIRNMTLITLADIGESLGYRFTIIPHKIEEDE